MIGWDLGLSVSGFGTQAWPLTYGLGVSGSLWAK